MLTQAWPLTGRFAEMEHFEGLLDDPGCDGAVLEGDAGVGKTRLAHEWAAVAERRGHAVLRAVASETASSVPLGALAHLVPEISDRSPADDPVALFRRADEALALLDSTGRVVLVVDDLHLLDATSLTLVHQLLAAERLWLIGTVRASAPLADAIEAMWRSARVARVELDPLPRPGVDTVLHLVLGGPLDAATAQELWESCEGNMLFLRELVLGARQRGSLVDEGGVWRVTDPLQPTRRLRQLIADRVAAVSAEAVAVLDLLALCAPVGLDDLAALAPPSALAELEEMGLLVITEDGRRRSATLGHPLHGEARRAELTSVATAAILLGQAERVEARGARRQEDDRRIAAWRLDATGTADPDLLLRAAKLARLSHDFDQVIRLARAARLEAPSAESGLLLGEALYESGRFAEAEELLAAATDEEWRDDPDDASGLAHLIAHKRATNLFWGCLRSDEALAVIRDARERVTSSSARNQLIAAEASTLMYSGSPRESLALLADLTLDDDDARGRAVRAVPEAPALVVTGQTEAAIAVARQAFDDQTGLDEQLAIAHPGTHIVSQVFALVESGQLANAVALGEAGYEVAVADRVPIARIWFALNLGRATFLEGRVATALGWFRQAAALARHTGFHGPLGMALNGVALAAATAGDAPTAAEATAELDALAPEFGFLAAEAALGRGWSAIAAGDPRQARQLFLDGADAARRSGHLTSEAWLRHDLVRVGQPTDIAEAAERLDELADQSDSSLVAARAHHARALVAADPVALTAVTDELEAMSALLLAAEAATSGADAYRVQGDQRAGAALGQRAAALAERTEGARTPGLAAPDVAVPLSPRERETALLAAEGLASKEIAERLFVSVRTVNNHLQSAYTKLGISRRDQLGDALGVDRRPGERG